MDTPTDPLASFRDWFKHEGRRYRIFKREQSKDAPWYLYFEHNHKRVLRCLETNVKENAISNARLIITAIKGQRWKELASAVNGSKLRHSDYATVSQIIAVCEKNPEGLKTMQKTLSALRCVIRAVHGDDHSRLSSTIFSASLVSRYRSAVIGADTDDETGNEARRAKITANSYLRQARSLFAPHMLDHFKHAGLKLPPTIEEFRKVKGFRHVTIEYSPPSDELLVQTFAQLDRLWHEGPGTARAKRRAIFAAVCLACGAGMRKGEIGRAKWNWFHQRDGVVWVRSDMIAKNGSPVDAPVVLDWWPRLQKIHAFQLARGATSESRFILEGISGSKTERTEWIFRWVSAWMRRLGWKTEKTIHEFRAWVGSKVAEKYGFTVAANFLRHGDEQTTRRHYGRYVKLKMLKLENLAA